MRGLTHRAVDAQAGVPAGSTSNHFRTREALLAGLVERFVIRERAMAEGPRGEVEPTAAGVARALGEFCKQATGPARVVTLARYAMLVEVAQQPHLAAVLVRGADEVDTWGLDLIARAGSPEPVRDHSLIANYVTGLVLHQLSLPAPDFDPTQSLAALIDTLDWSPS